MTEIEKLQQAIIFIEEHRDQADPEIIHTATVVLQKQIERLKLLQQTYRQRKLVTIVFADVTGFTALSETMDAEDVNEWINALWTPIDQAIREHGGKIDKHMGDAVMGLFGTPIAQEDDPLRAIEASLAILKAVKQFNLNNPDRPDLSMRIGINTGLVLLGEVGTTGEFTAIGDAVNIASRLQSAAPVDTILISHSTYRHVSGTFNVVVQDPLQVKGKSEPIQTYVVQGKKPHAFHLQTRGVEGINTRMVGRDRELHFLQDEFHAMTLSRRLRMTMVSGEAGIGKSRLVDEFIQWIDIQVDNIWLFKGRSSPQSKNLPYSLFRDLFSYRFGIAENDSRAIVHRKFEHGLQLFVNEGTAEMTHFIGHLIGFDYADSPYISGILNDPQQIRDRARHYLTRLISRIVNSAPILFLFEDIHWADEASMDLARHLFRECAPFPVMMLGVTRPILFETQPHWEDILQESSGYNRLNLEPLSDAASRELINEILCYLPEIPVDLHHLIIRNAEGNPYYVEELIKMLIEEEVITKDTDHWHFHQEHLDLIKIPTTLVGVLQARLDSLPSSEQTILRIASVFGRVFWDRAIASLYPAKTRFSEVLSVLNILHSKELTFRRSPSTFDQTQEYFFKHAILRDVTYESVLLEQRRNYHARAAQWLVAQSGDRVDQYAGLVAEHFEMADNRTEASQWYCRAGRQAERAYAPETAIHFYQKSLELTTESNDYQNLAEIHTGLGDMLYARARFDEAIDSYHLLADMAAENMDNVTLAHAWNSLAQLFESQGNYQESLERAAKVVELPLPPDENGQAEMAMAFYHQGRAHFRLGNAAQALDYGKRALGLSMKQNTKHLIAMSLALLGSINWMMGYYDRAEFYHRKSLDQARKIGDRLGEVSRLNGIAVTASERGDYQQAIDLYREALELARQIGNRRQELLLLSNIGDSLVQIRHYKEAEETLQEVITKVGRDYMYFIPDTYISLAWSRMGQSKYAAATEAAVQALRLEEESKNPQHIGEAWRVLAHIAQKTGKVLAFAEELTPPDCFDRSTRTFTEGDMEHRLAKTMYEWADYEIRWGDSAKGKTLSRDALKLFEKLGIEPKLMTDRC